MDDCTTTLTLHPYFQWSKLHNPTGRYMEGNVQERKQHGRFASWLFSSSTKYRRNTRRQVIIFILSVSMELPMLIRANSTR
ncbi:hypothetical protein DAEQUDRAFT_592405 [Daedalea quercina L-15889]|uniref:Uncharacterized protein n=1 Tax=Daedalea quercina L-15889 TaxID=1314783 RepID=A0A165SWU1_9APHY|nr:hypothetical protein DAEQUDRAFT_592405 [Daedalea quercina L-15889]